MNTIDFIGFFVGQNQKSPALGRSDTSRLARNHRLSSVRREICGIAAASDRSKASISASTLVSVVMSGGQKAIALRDDPILLQEAVDHSAKRPGFPHGALLVRSATFDGGDQTPHHAPLRRADATRACATVPACPHRPYGVADKVALLDQLEISPVPRLRRRDGRRP